MLKRTIQLLPEHVFPTDAWRVIEARYSGRYAARAETIFALSNGYLGIRGTPDEGRPVFSPGTFVNGFHETWPIVHAEEAYGLARTGQTIVNVPTPALSSSTSMTSRCSCPGRGCVATPASWTCAPAR